jgi:hypothetical protein
LSRINNVYIIDKLLKITYINSHDEEKMSERFKVLVLKTNVTNVTIGSNPIFLKIILITYN